VRTSFVQANELAGAEQAVSEALIAVRDRDVGKISSLLYSRSIVVRQLNYAVRMPRALDRLCRNYALDGLSDYDLKRNVRVVPNASRTLIVNILQSSVGRGYPAEWLSWEQDRPVVVEYSVRGKRMISVVLREDGKWKLSALPLCLSANALKYGSLRDYYRMETDEARLEP